MAKKPAKDARAWYGELITQLRRSYMRAYADSVRMGEVPLERGDELLRALREPVQLSDLLVASKLRQGATGERVNISDGLTIASLKRANPWFANHSLLTNPIIEERVRGIVHAERQFLTRVTGLRVAEMHLPTKSKLLARADMMLRHATAVISEVSEQVQLSIPEIGEMFPVGQYLTRDDRRVRPTHKAMYGFLAARGNEIWATIRPPNGFNCRCFVRWVTRSEAKREGWEKISVRWPNSASKRNFDQRIFPDEGWRGPKIIANNSLHAA